jgi:opacity protein-like surface antigen
MTPLLARTLLSLLICPMFAVAANGQSNAELLAALRKLEARVAQLEVERTQLKQQLQSARSGDRNRVPVAVVQPATAAQTMSRPPFWTWRGVYVGGSAGVGALQSRRSIGSINTFTATGNPPSVSNALFNSSGSDFGGVMDAYVGWNETVGSAMLIGGQLEATLAQINLAQAGTTVSRGPNFSSTGENLTGFRMGWMVTALARLGWVISDADMMYALGGWSYARFRDDYAAKDFALNGPSLGAGWEHRIGSSPWTIKAEYRYTHFMDGNFTFASSWQSSSPGFSSAGTSESSANVRANLHSARIGASYLISE